MITPGLYDGIPDVEYHGDRESLSSTGARTLVTRTPAEFRWEQLHGRPPKADYDFGHAAHKLILGEGAEIVEIDADDYYTKAAKEAKVKAYAENKIPMKRPDMAKARDVEKAVRNHRLAGALFADGVAEQSGWWVDPGTGVMCRYRADWTTWRRGRHLYLVDLKTTDDASPDSFAKSVYNFGYHQQDPWYSEGARILHPDAKRISFLFVAVSKQPPHMVNVFELDSAAKEIGARRNAAALETYARCIATDEWPDHGIGPHLISLPRWATYREETAQ